MEMIFFGFGGVVCALLVVSALARHQTEQRIALRRLESKVDWLLENAGFQSTNEMSEVRQALKDGTKIRAIKIYREVSGADLGTAKKAVDQMQRGETPGPITRQ